MLIWLCLLLVINIEALSVRFSSAYLRDIAKPLNYTITKFEESQDGIRLIRSDPRNQSMEVEVKISATKKQAEIFRNEISVSPDDD